MERKTLDKKALQDLLLKNWMTHDALWYNEAAARFGMAEASPMNLRVCRNLGRIEFHRLIKEIGAFAPRDMEAYTALFDLGCTVFVPEFMKWTVSYPEENTQVFHVEECFAHKGMEKAGLLPDYECGIFERIEGWFDAMRLTRNHEPDLSRCLKYRGEPCIVTLRFEFPSTVWK